MISVLLFIFSAMAQECPRSKIRRVDVIESPKITEASGMIVTDELIWVHNDSGDSPTVYAIDFNGHPLGDASIDGAFARDWEDASSFQKGGERYFILGDIGDNKERKSFTEFYVIKEPGLLGNIPLLYSFTAEYEVGSKDAEAMFVDPRTNELIILTKGREGIAYWLRGTIPEKKEHITLKKSKSKENARKPTKNEAKQRKRARPLSGKSTSP